MTIQNQQQYKFFYGTKNDLDRLIGLGLVNQNHLYYLTDKQQIYVGDKLYGSEFVTVEEFPSEPKINTLYIKSSTKEVRIFDGLEYKTVCLPVSQNLDLDYSLATSKAIRDYIKNISDKNITGIEYRVESQSLNVLYGDGSTKNILLKEIITGVNYDSQTGNFEFSRANGEGIIINTPKENFLSDVKYDPYKNTITFTMVNGTTFDVDLTDLIEIYTTEDTQSIDMNLSGNKIFANLKLSNKEDNRAKLDENGLYVPDTDLSNYFTSNEIISKIDEVFTPLQQEVDRLEIDKQNNLTAGVGIRIDNNVISSMFSNVEWGNIQGNILDQEDLQEQFSNLQSTIESNISTTEGQLQGKIDSLESNTTEKLNSLELQINQLDSDLSKEIQDTKTEIENTIQPKLDQLDKDLDTAQENLSKEISDTKTEIENTIQPKLDELDSTKQDVLTSANAGDGISIVDGIISNTRVSAEWGNIQGDITTQTDLQTELDTKVDIDDMVEIEMVEVDIDGIKSDIQNLENAKVNKSNVTSKGNSTTPVYFDANGVAQPITSYSGNANTATQATKAVQDKNGWQIDTTYMYKTIGSQYIPATPTDITRLAMVGKQGCGNGVISGGELVSLHSNTAYKCYERKGATITCNYDDKVGNLGKSMCDGSYSGHYPAINPSTMFTDKPFVWEVVSPSQFEVSDVLRLHLYGHRLTDQVNCTAFKIEAYIQDTLDNTKKWITAYNYSGASVNIAQTGWGLYITGHSTNPYYSIFGIRLTISSSPDTIFKLSEIQLVASRGTERVCDAIQCLSTDGGKIWGDLEVVGNLTNKTQPENTNNTTVATTAFVKNNTVTKTLDGTSKKTWIGTSAKYETDKASGLITNTTECLITDDEQELILGVDTYTKDEIDDKIKSSYYVGQTIFSLDPLNYASLRLLDGSLLQVGGIYDEFISKYIEPLFKKHPNRFISESEWQQQVSTYGICGKYVYTEGVAVRLPKVTGIVEGTIDPSALGDLVEAGLPAHTHTRGTMNITGSFAYSCNEDSTPAVSGAYTRTAISTDTNNGAGYQGDGNSNNYTFAFDASRSWTGSTSDPNYTNDIKTTETVQPQTIKGYYYIVVASGIDEEVNLKFDTLDVDYARSDLSNLTQQGKTHFVNKSQITNCLLEAPQNIKLELNNGTLTLKAGSKVIVPNGFEADGVTKRFDEKTIAKDLTISYILNGGATLLYYNGVLDYMRVAANTASANTPTVNMQYMKWYDTTNNMVKATNDTGANWSTGYSLPLCLFTASETADADGKYKILSIDQVFNGFGCIGGMTWMNKGVKLSISNGFNEDSTVKNEEIVNSNVLLSSNIVTANSSSTYLPFFRLHKTAKTPQMYMINRDQFLGELDYTPTLDTTKFQWYLNTNEMKWYMHDTNETQWISTPYYNISPPITIANNVITSFKPYKPFRAIGYNDKSIVSGWSMPSDRYVDLTLGTSGTTYTAPANGWFYIDKYAGANNAYIDFDVNSKDGNLKYKNTSCVPLSNYVDRLLVPVVKGDVLTCKYSASGTTNYFRFIYAEGEV